MPARIAAAGGRASFRFPEFFAANIRNPHTRRVHTRAVAEFMTWREDNGGTSIGATNRGVETSVREAFNLDLATIVVRECCWSGDAAARPTASARR